MHDLVVAEKGALPTVHLTKRKIPTARPARKRAPRTGCNGILLSAYLIEELLHLYEQFTFSADYISSRTAKWLERTTEEAMALIMREIKHNRAHNIHNVYSESDVCYITSKMFILDAYLSRVRSVKNE